MLLPSKQFYGGKVFFHNTSGPEGTIIYLFGAQKERSGETTESRKGEAAFAA